MCVTCVVGVDVVVIHVVSDFLHNRSAALYRPGMQRQLCSQVEILIAQLRNIHRLIPRKLILNQRKLVLKQLKLVLLQLAVHHPGSLIAAGLPPIQIQPRLGEVQLVSSHTLSGSNLVGELLSRHLVCCGQSCRRIKPVRQTSQRIDTRRSHLLIKLFSRQLLRRRQPRRCIKPIRKTSGRVDPLCSQRCCLPSIQPRRSVKAVRKTSSRIDPHIKLADLLSQPVRLRVRTLLRNPPIQTALADSQSTIQRSLTDSSRQARNIHPGSQPGSNSTRIQTQERCQISGLQRLRTGIIIGTNPVHRSAITQLVRTGPQILLVPPEDALTHKLAVSVSHLGDHTQIVQIGATLIGTRPSNSINHSEPVTNQPRVYPGSPHLLFQSGTVVVPLRPLGVSHIAEIAANSVLGGKKIFPHTLSLSIV